MNELIKVTQLPIIEERLRSMKGEIEATVNEATALVCTEDTIQAVKEKRADLRKLYDELEQQRKAVKAAVLGPYEAFEDVYRECVAEPMKQGDAELKRKIEDTEEGIKARCEAELRDYFDELCAAHGLNWLTFERAGVKVDMASARQKTPKKLREQLVNFVARVSRKVDAIADMENADEILAEYKARLDFVDAIDVVNERHRRIEEERTAREARAAQKAVEAEAVRKVEALAPPTVQTEPEPTITASFKMGYNDLISVLSWMICNGYNAPVMQVTDTRARLVALREWMKANGYQYK